MTKFHLSISFKETILLLGVTLILSISACGFSLRGSGALHLPSLYIQSEWADRITNEIKRILSEDGIALAPSAKTAQVIVYLRHEVIDKRVLSVSAISGKLEEVELNYRVELEARQPDETVVLKKQLLSLLRDYSFDAHAVLAMGTEEEVLREELFQDMVAQVVRRLRAIKISS